MTSDYWREKNILKGLLLNRWSSLKIGHHNHIGGGPTLGTPADQLIEGAIALQ